MWVGNSQRAYYGDYFRVRPVWPFKILKAESRAAAPEGARSRCAPPRPRTLYKVPIGLMGTSESFHRIRAIQNGETTGRRGRRRARGDRSDGVKHASHFIAKSLQNWRTNYNLELSVDWPVDRQFRLYDLCCILHYFCGVDSAERTILGSASLFASKLLQDSQICREI